jgi:hypothetical protein
MPKREVKGYTAHGTAGLKLVFDEQEMDYGTVIRLAMASMGGAELGEVLYATSEMEDGNRASWIREWPIMAARVEARAEDCLKKGHKVSAREAYMRAASYYQAPLFWMDPRKPDLENAVAKSRHCFRTAAGLFDPPIEVIQVPYKGKKLPGYFKPVEKGGKKRKTFIAIGGAETWCEFMWYQIGPAAIARGYNFLTVDLPGEGSTPDDDMPYITDYEAPMKSVLDYALSRPEVDPKHVAAYGISMGGYMVPRAACYEKRIKACIGNPVIAGFGDMASIPMNLGGKDMRLGNARMMAWRQGDKATLKFNDEELLKQLDSVGVASLMSRGLGFDPSLITCPLLSVVPEHEYQSPMGAASEKALAVVKTPKPKLIVTPSNLGAGNHCAHGNLGVCSQVVFDWLDEVFD